MWRGDTVYLLENLVVKDFRIRYRNMSLGVLWSVINPLVMMLVLTFVFTILFPSTTTHFAVFLLCGLVPFNFFANSFQAGTLSVVDNAHLIKRVPVPRAFIPISSVTANLPHLLIQMLLVFGIAALFGVFPNIHWLWLPLLWAFELLFVCGLALYFSALNVYIRDIRYVVESSVVVLWWLVPIIYPFSMIPQQYAPIYEYNPIAAIVLAMRTVILEQRAPSDLLMMKLGAVSLLTAVTGWFFFRRLERDFYTHL